MPHEFRSDSPVWIQLTDFLREMINSGQIPPRGKLPSINALMQEYGIADQTAQKAIRALRDEGLVRTHRGLGSYVIPPDERS
ncbi:MAG TPA: winged helix-turn-helix domain-containing protein [Streptosporangiaceae bacterium]|jgi:GntR family transcriptional regulator|nr:winged helix-turn-helix domain-containing protein [Streptosporangiaceae bacterium]